MRPPARARRPRPSESAGSRAAWFSGRPHSATARTSHSGVANPRPLPGRGVPCPARSGRDVSPVRPSSATRAFPRTERPGAARSTQRRNRRNRHRRASPHDARMSGQANTVVPLRNAWATPQRAMPIRRFVPAPEPWRDRPPRPLASTTLPSHRRCRARCRCSPRW